jgi:hypothetical protein
MEILETGILFAEAVTAGGLSTAGLVVMCVSIGAVLSLLSFCLYKVFSLPPVEVEEHLKGPLEIDTGDTD